MFFFALWLLISGPSSAHASVYDKVNLKMYEKIRTRWALENLFVRNRRSKPREQWLPYNPKKPPMFELMADVRMGTLSYFEDYHNPKKQPLKVASGGLNVFLGPVGFGIQREQYKFSDKMWNRDEGTFYLRVLGSSMQTTHFTILAGQQKSDHALFEEFEQQYFGYLANIYISRYFGIEGFYRKRSGGQPKYDISGADQHWGVFVDISILRLSLLFRQEWNTYREKADTILIPKGYESFKGTVAQARLNF